MRNYTAIRVGVGACGLFVFGKAGFHCRAAGAFAHRDFAKPGVRLGLYAADRVGLFFAAAEMARITLVSAACIDIMGTMPLTPIAMMLAFARPGKRVLARLLNRFLALSGGAKGTHFLDAPRRIALLLRRNPPFFAHAMPPVAAAIIGAVFRTGISNGACKTPHTIEAAAGVVEIAGGNFRKQCSGSGHRK